MLAGNKIDIDSFVSKSFFPFIERAAIVAKNPVTVAEWFNKVIKCYFCIIQV